MQETQYCYACNIVPTKMSRLAGDANLSEEER